MKWKVSFYSNAVYNDFMQWPNKIKGRFIRSVELMEEYGADLDMPHTKSLGNGLFELRVRGQEGIGRAFFCYAVSECIIILHGFIKKTQKTPSKELRLAKERLKKVKNHEL
ncbi:MAG: hypothetical protein ACD_21C00077G0005 [uncultured bacterium]|nr:MAG: hypothetical protein ACD_21C00077G0005 [uncultured bacterium]